MKTIIKVVCIICMSVSLTACWSSTELTELAIGTALAIDTHEDGYQVTIQVINPSEIAGNVATSRTTVSTYSATGKTFFNAIRKLTSTTPRKVFLSHIRVIIIGNELAEQGIRKQLDFMSRDHEMRTDFAIAIAKGMRAEDLVKVLTPLEKIPANKIYTSLQTSEEYWAPTRLVELDQLLSAITSTGKEAVLTGFFINGDPEYGTGLENVRKVESPTNVRVDNIGLFKGDRLVGWFNEDESKGYNYITNEVKNSAESISCKKEGRISVEVIESQTELIAKYVNNKPKFEVKIYNEVNIADVECSIDLTRTSTINSLQKQLEDKFTNLANQSIDAARDYRSDVFGFGDFFSKKYPKEWRVLKQNWETEWMDYEINVDANVNIKRTGTITDTIMGE